MVKPNFYDCQECTHWDDVNDCERNAKNIFDSKCEYPEDNSEEDYD